MAAKGNIFADLPRTEQIKVAQTAELKGDLARIHEEFGNAVNYYRTALRAAPGDAKIENKLGLAYLQMGNRGSARKAFADNKDAQTAFTTAAKALKLQ